MQAQLRPPSSLPFTAELHLLTASLLFGCQSHRRSEATAPVCTQAAGSSCAGQTHSDSEDQGSRSLM